MTQLSKIDVEKFMSSLEGAGVLSDPGFPALDNGGWASIYLFSGDTLTRFNHVIYEMTNPGHVLLESGGRELEPGESVQTALSSESVDYRRNRLVFDMVWAEVHELAAKADAMPTSDSLNLNLLMIESGLLNSGSEKSVEE